LFVEAAPEGWWYYAPLPGGQAVAAYLTDSDLLPRDRGALGPFWERQRGRTRLVADLLGRAAPAKALRVTAANAAWSGTVAGPRWLAVGDAAMAHDPLSGLGICQGLASGWHAARAVIAHSQGHPGAIERYQRWVEVAYRTYRAEHARLYGRVARWPDSPFWKRRAAPG
jgi:flavin-dependent dehydrogenase